MDKCSKILNTVSLTKMPWQNSLDPEQTLQFQETISEEKFPCVLLRDEMYKT